MFTEDYVILFHPSKREECLVFHKIYLMKDTNPLTQRPIVNVDSLLSFPSRYNALMALLLQMMVSVAIARRQKKKTREKGKSEKEHDDRKEDRRRESG